MRPSVVIALVTALVAAAPATAGAAPGGAHPSAVHGLLRGFRPLDLAVAGTSVASPADGVAYVAVPTTGGYGIVRVTAGPGRPRVEPVTVPVATVAPAVLHAGGGRVFTGTGLEVVGTTTRPVPPPPGTTSWQAWPMAVDTDGSLWVAGAPTRRDPAGIARWDGSAWTVVVQGLPSGVPRDLHVRDGVAQYVYEPDRWPAHEVVEVWNGQVAPRPSAGAWGLTPPAVDGYTDAWVEHGADDYTMWGHAAQRTADAATAPHGACTRVVLGRATACPAPEWAVSAAVTRADGVTVLGGTDAVRGPFGSPVTGAAPAGFSVVATPGGVPAPVAGDPGDETLDLAAAGDTVWALTRTGTTTTLQVMEPRPGHLPAPRAPRRPLPRHP